jgi:hypothetical protein
VVVPNVGRDQVRSASGEDAWHSVSRAILVSALSIPMHSDLARAWADLAVLTRP